MITCNKLIAAGRGLAPALLKRASTLTLDWDVRQKSRFEASDSVGRQLGIFMPRGSVLRGGDVLVAEDGSLIKVIAAPQTLLRITARAQGSPFDLTRAAYHLGNRHVPIELAPGFLQIEPDHVLAELLTALQLLVHEVQAAFEPEAGAYAAVAHAGPASHTHAGPASHTHAAPAAHTHAGPAAHTHAAPAAHTHAAPAAHVHGPHCNHGADHTSGAAHSDAPPAPIQIHRHKPHAH